MSPPTAIFTNFPCSSVQEVVVCGHSLEVNVTTSLDFYLSVAQVQLLQQLLKDNMLGSDAPEKRTEVHNTTQRKNTEVEINQKKRKGFWTHMLL